MIFFFLFSFWRKRRGLRREVFNPRTSLLVDLCVHPLPPRGASRREREDSEVSDDKKKGKRETERGAGFFIFPVHLLFSFFFLSLFSSRLFLSFLFDDSLALSCARRPMRRPLDRPRLPACARRPPLPHPKDDGGDDDDDGGGND